jgi:hypothetical protein
VGAPVGGCQLAKAIGPDRDAAVYDGDQVRKGDEIQDVTAPWPVNAGKQQIAVESRPESFLFIDGGIDCFDTEIRCRGTTPKALGQYIHLEPADIFPQGVRKPIQIPALDMVKVHEHHVLESRPGQCLCDEAADASGPDDTDAEADKVLLGFLAPGGNRPFLLIRGNGRWGKCVHVGQGQSISDDTYCSG